jgi:hypothetical protein
LSFFDEPLLDDKNRSFEENNLFGLVGKAKNLRATILDHNSFDQTPLLDTTGHGDSK